MFNRTYEPVKPCEPAISKTYRAGHDVAYARDADIPDMSPKYSAHFQGKPDWSRN